MNSWWPGREPFREERGRGAPSMIAWVLGQAGTRHVDGGGCGAGLRAAGEHIADQRDSDCRDGMPVPDRCGVLMQPKEPTPRRAGRVLVIDPAGRVLLLQGFDPAKPSSLHWITIGGGTDHGEGTAQAALRELWEEAGISATAGELIGPVWQRTTEFSFYGMRYRQEEDYCVLHV